MPTPTAKFVKRAESLAREFVINQARIQRIGWGTTTIGLLPFGVDSFTRARESELPRMIRNHPRLAGCNKCK
jgi:hypothetical protein